MRPLYFVIVVGLLSVAPDQLLAQQPVRLVAPSTPEKAPEIAWKGEVDDVATRRVDAVFALPDGFARVARDSDRFAAFLRALPVRADRTVVRSYKGAALGSPAAGIVLLDVGSTNVQQCADSVIRLHAEWLWSEGRADEVGYHFTSGDLSTWKHWRAGERFKIDGAKVKRVRGAARKATHGEFRRYLTHLFMYAGTRSLSRDSDVVEPGDARPGDFFVQPGSPGHAVMLLDVATGPDGRRYALIGQGFMPAQEFHVVKSTRSEVVNGVWFPLPRTASETVKTPSWAAFRGSELRRFK